MLQLSPEGEEAAKLAERYQTPECATGTVPQTSMETEANAVFNRCARMTSICQALGQYESRTAGTRVSAEPVVFVSQSTITRR